MAGKGDTPRPVVRAAFEAGYDRIWKKDKMIMDEQDIERQKDDYQSMSHSEIRKIVNKKCCGGHCGSCDEK